jgi:hypothetical protein
MEVLMIYFILIGVMALTVGFMFVFFPGGLRSINEKSVKIITNIDACIFRYHIGVGLALIISSFLFFFLAYYINQKG